ncbi:MAG TPA: DNA-binding protein [Nitrospirota bacterium]|nr:DNA-binding protein [Nitrospirota bacterium]
MKKFTVYALILISFSALFALVTVSVYGQQGFGRFGGRGGSRGEGKQSYDPSRAEVVSGEVSSVKDIETKNGKMSGAGLELITSGGQLLVFLGPHVYVDLQNIRISVGDKVDIKGVKTAADGQALFIAGEVRKGDEVLKLRDDKGVPLWAGNKQQGGR